MSLEDRMRAVFKADASPQGGPEELWPGIEERLARRGRFRRRLRVAAWLVPVLAAVGAVPAYEALAPAGRPQQVVSTIPTPVVPTGTSGVATSPGPGAPTQGVVPWADLPAQPTPGYPATADAQACTASQLQAGFVTGDGGGGTTLFSVSMTNISPTPCILAGYPTSLSGIRADGQIVDLHPARGASELASDISYPGLLLSGASGQEPLYTFNVCDGGPTPYPGSFPAMDIGMPGGGTVRAKATGFAAALGFDFHCGAEVGPLGAPPLTIDPAPAYAALIARFAPPPSATAGSTLRAVLTLINPTTSTIPLTPCPDYEFVLNASLLGAHQLNCAAAHAIGPGAAESFALQVSIPGGADNPGVLAFAIVAQPPGGGTPSPMIPYGLQYSDYIGVAPAPGPATVPPCASSDLRGSGSGGGVASGEFFFTVTLTNTSARSCWLGGYPTEVTGVAADGKQTPLVFRPFGDDPNRETPGTVGAGQVGMITMATSDLCQSGGGPTPGDLGTFSAVQLGLPGGGALQVPGNRSFPVAFLCDLQTSQFGVPRATGRLALPSSAPP